MTLPSLTFPIQGRDQSGRAFSSVRRNLGDTRRDLRLLNIDARAATASITGLGKSALIGATGIGGVAAAFHKMKTSLADFDRIAKVARQNGLNGEFYQTLAFMAGEASLEVSTLDTALRKFTLGVTEAANGTGALYSQLSKTRPDLLKALLTAEDGEQRFRVFADAIRGAATAEERLSLAAAAFGSRGAELVRVLELGSGAMDDANRRATENGNIINDELLPGYEDLQTRLGNASDALSKQLGVALVAVAGEPMVGMMEGLSRILMLLTSVADASRYTGAALYGLINAGEFKPFTDDDVLANLGAQRVDIEAKIFDLRRRQQEVTGATAELEKRMMNAEIEHLQKRMKAIAEAEARILSKPSAKESPSSGLTIPAAHGRWTDPAETRKTQKAAEDKEKAYRRVIDQLNRETAALGMNSVQQRIANQLALAGVDATSKQGQQIARMVTFLEEQRAAQEAYNERLQFFGDLGADVFRGLVRGGDDFADVMRRVGLSIADAAMQAAIFGTGPLAGLLGLGGSSNLLGLFGFGGGGGGSSLFSGWYADGGTIPAGKWGIAGEAGPEIITGPARVWTADDMAAIAGRGGDGGSTQVIVSLSPELEAEILQQAEGQAVRIVQQYDKDVAPGTAIRAVGNANRLSTGSAFRRG